MKQAPLNVLERSCFFLLWQERVGIALQPTVEYTDCNWLTRVMERNNIPAF